MPSEDSKTVMKKEEMECKEDDDDEICLSSMGFKKRKPVSSNNGTCAVKPQDKVKKDVPHSYGSDKSIRVTKKENVEEKEEDDGDGELCLNRVIKGAKVTKEKNVEEKDEDDDDDDDDYDDEEKPLRRVSTNKPDKDLKKKKKKVTMANTDQKKKVTVDNTDLKKKVKKVYDLPGQKRDPPEERDPLRIFYETLFKQNPNSEMALFWMMESGLLSKEEAKKAFEKKQNKTQHQKTSSQTKPTKNTGSAAGNVTKKTPISSIKKKETEPKAPPKQTKKRKIGNGSSDDTSDDDFIVNRSMKKK
ncbi:hypothetical protein CsatB_008400 [Cannabis sativa]|uniref:Uncharacterized protein n=1 Tax=Cannabis sativa TaxID=3483 RepID=A0A7J6HHS0_CANSA|nr:uncharacterized protein LOC115698339 [Cannabis sativa]KAF4373064.1 hypothetical protein F8388_019246 [Cannabis sativa]KAF4394834.1 hypothetical protein G4B88_002711 [Cannabis sativa]